MGAIPYHEGGSRWGAHCPPPLLCIWAAWVSTATVPGGTATAGAAFGLYAAGAPDAYLNRPVQTGQRTATRGARDGLFRICYCDIPTLGHWFTPPGRILGYLGYLSDGCRVRLGVPLRSLGAGAGVVELGSSACDRSTAAAETGALPERVSSTLAPPCADRLEPG